MRKLKIPALCVLLVFLLTAATWASDAELQALTGSGQCGDAITWNLDAAGNLTVTGTGDFYAYDEDSDDYLPWRRFTHYIVDVTISDGISSVPDYAFRQCDYLESVTLGKDVETIGQEAFAGCVRLEDFPNADGLKTIGEAAFIRCGFPNLTIPDNVTEIGEGAFNDCESLESIVIGSGLTYVDRGVFSSCPVLKSVVIPATVTVIDENAFSGEIDNVYYAGTAAQWNKIRGGGADSLANLAWNVHFESTGPDGTVPMTYQISVVGKNEDGIKMQVNATGNGFSHAFAVKVYYDQNGKYIDSDWYSEQFPTDDNVFNLWRWYREPEAKTAKLIILDRQFRPLCQSDTIAFES